MRLTKPAAIGASQPDPQCWKLCTRKDDGNFKGYLRRKGTTPYVVSLSWDFAPAETLLIMFSEDESSRMLLVAAGASHPPSAIGSDNPPPPPPGRVRAPADYWSRLTNAPLFRGGGRYLMMQPHFPRDFLFELPATSGSPEALHCRR